MKGAGIWIRLGARPSPEEIVEHLDYVVIPLHSGERGPIGMGPSLRQWCADVQAGGVEIWAMDWLPDPDSLGHVEALCDDARELGAVGLMVDAEPDAGWRGRTARAQVYRRQLAQHAAGLDLAVTDYARGGIGRATLMELLAEVDGVRPVAVPQSYDPGGAYREGYHEESAALWESYGATRTVIGAGAWLRGERRHRTPPEMRRHLAHVPARSLGVCAWYASLRGLRPLLPVIAEHRASTQPRPSWPRDPGVTDPISRAAADLARVALELRAAGYVDAAVAVVETAERIGSAVACG